MRVHISKKLVDLIKERGDWGQIKEVTKLTLFQSFSHHGEPSVKQLLGGLVKNDCLSSDITVTPDYNFVFKGPKKEVLRQIESIPKPVKKTPEKMQVKMIARRLVKIPPGLEYARQKDQERRLYGPMPPPLTRAQVSGEGMKAYADTNVYLYDEVFKQMKKAARELIKILNRANVTEDIINQAWDQFQIETTLTE